jgi:hypothetical protein
MEIIKISELLKELAEWKTLVFLVIVGVLGILGSFAKKYTTTSETSEGRKSNIKYIIVGATAAIVILLVITPTSAIMLVSLSIAAGYAGKAVLDNIGIKQRLNQELNTANKKQALSNQKLKNTSNEMKKVKKSIGEITEVINGLEPPELLNKIVMEPQKVKINEKEKINLESFIKSPGAIKNKLYQLDARLDTLISDAAVYTKFVIILDEDFENDTEQYKVVYETDNEKDARSHTQYEKTVAEYPRDDFSVKKIGSIEIKHTKTGVKKKAGIYELRD